MRSSFEGLASRFAMLVCGLAIFSSACGGGGGGGGQGGAKADGGMGGVKADAGVGGQGVGGAKADAGVGGQGVGGAGPDGGGQGGAGGTFVPPWHAFLPLGAAAAGSTAAMGTTLDLTANHYDATYYGTTINFTNAALNLNIVAGGPPELVVIPPKSAGPAVDVTGSYSVSVWVSMADVSGYRTFVSSEGFNIASFFLQKRGGGTDTNAFAFTVSSADSIAAPGCVVPGAGAAPDGGSNTMLVVPVVNTQYHLVATRDGATGMSILYVNGVESGRALCAGGWADTGIVGIGHGIFNAGRGDFVRGSIADLGLINRVLTPAEVADLFARGSTVTPRPDAGPDVGPDIRPDTGPDAGPDAPVDTPVDTPAGTDATAPDAPSDGG